MVINLFNRVFKFITQLPLFVIAHIILILGINNTSSYGCYCFMLLKLQMFAHGLLTER
jgi:hypothetical protein